MLLAEHGAAGKLNSCLVELGAMTDRHAAGRLAELYNLSPGVMWPMKPLPDYPDLPMHGYKDQPFFHQIDTAFPGLQLISEEPFIFVCQKFFSPDECEKLINYFSLSAEQMSSATYQDQTEIRTSTTVIPSEDHVRPLRERMAMLTRCGTNQMEVTKLTRYGKGQFFRSHSDVKADLSRHNLNQLLGEGEPRFVPDVFCTVFVYLNDVPEGGCTRWRTDDSVDRLFEMTLPKLGEKVGRAFSLKARNATTDVKVKPKAGMAVVHFPCTKFDHGCLVDPLGNHEGEEAVHPKFIVQQFIKARPLAEAQRIKQRVMVQ